VRWRTIDQQLCRRGRIAVLDRRRLEGTTCGCYAADRQSYAELIH
jgi:hypothetical protein